MSGSITKSPMLKSLHTRQYALLLQELRAARAAAGLSQIALAERLDMQQSDVSKCERGTRRLDVVELRQWGQALGVGLVELVQRLDERIAADEALSSQAVPRPHPHRTD